MMDAVQLLAIVVLVASACILNVRLLKIKTDVICKEEELRQVNVLVQKFCMEKYDCSSDGEMH